MVQVFCAKGGAGMVVRSALHRAVGATTLPHWSLATLVFAACSADPSSAGNHGGGAGGAPSSGQGGTIGASTQSGGSVPMDGSSEIVSTNRPDSSGEGVVTDAAADRADPPYGNDGSSAVETGDAPTFPIGDPGTMGDGDFMAGPTYTTQPELTDRGAPKGKAFRFTMDSTASSIFKGDDKTLLAQNQHAFTRA